MIHQNSLLKNITVISTKRNVFRATQNICIGRKSPVYPVNRALRAGSSNAHTETSFRRFSHSQTKRYILSPLGLSDLCREMRLKPALAGKYLK